MKYMLKSGGLYKGNDLLAYIKSDFIRSEKKIFSIDGSLLFQANICHLDAPSKSKEDVRFHQYVLTDTKGTTYAKAHPDYSTKDNPDIYGWPVCRMPKVDHARIQMSGNKYDLSMQDNQHYTFQKENGEKLIQISHRGLSGGWTIETTEDMRPEIICGIFIFCRYIEQENEFFIV